MGSSYRPPLGAQPQRTALAAQRTALTLVVTGVLVGRLALDDVGVLALVVPAVIVALIGLALVVDRRVPVVLAAGVRTAILTVGIAALCLLELVAILV